MRIAWIKPGGLWPLNTGGRLRTFETVRALSRTHRVVLITTSGPADQPDELERQLPDCERVTSVPWAPPKVGARGFTGALVRSWASRYPVDLWRWRAGPLRSEVARVLAEGGFDAVVADFLVAVPNLPAVVNVPVVLFEHNVEYRIWQRLAQVERRWWKRLALEVEWRKMRALERAGLRRSAATIAVSEGDRVALRHLCPSAHVDVVPTGVDLAYFAPRPGREVARRLVFTGSMDWYPNEDGILHFAAEVWPNLRARFPDVSMTVVGRNPGERLVATMKQCDIAVTGTVPDVRPHIAEAQVYVVPLRVAGGTRLKIFEALAMGKAVVSTTIGAEGLGLTPGVHYLAADTPHELTDAISALLTDAAARSALERDGRAFVQARYGWDAVTTAFSGVLEHAIERSTMSAEDIVVPASA